ncbi:MAG: hypothetical protein OXR68_03070 [Alphaproteobacteria bacterium]|nr:hypothetical protein [Alphaproteobacteria bacterium]MDD9919586.1 hypothetical protein [Alphaproteobacteria bacterium]
MPPLTKKFVTVLILCSSFGVVTSYAQSWGKIATAATTTAGYLCDVTSDSKDIICEGPNPYVDASGNLGVGTITPTTALEVAGVVSASAFVGDGSSLTNIAAGAVTMGIDDLTDAAVDNTNNNVFLTHEGGAAGANNDYNIAIGQTALDSLDNDATANAGDWNVAVGYDALTKNTVGHGNVAIGGMDALSENISGDYNIGIGREALEENTVGRGNLGIGYRALTSNSVGSHNIGLGYLALNGIAGHSVTGTVAIGYQAGSGAQTGGNYNTLIGYEAGESITTGTNNVTLGYEAGDNITTGSNNIVIGQAVDAVSTTADDQLNIGNTIYGDLSTDQVGIGVTDPQVALEVAGTISATGVEVVGTVTATNFVGDGSGLTNVPAGSADWYDVTNIPTGVVNISNTALDAAELGELQNIDTTTISAAQWDYVGALDQGLSTTADVQFANLDASSISITGHLSATTISATYIEGDGSLLTNIAAGAVAMGIDDLVDGEYNLTTDNMFIGHQYGTALTNNTGNLAIGENALDSLTDSATGSEGDFNTAIGLSALTANTTGYNSTVIGYQAALNNTVGDRLLAVGSSSLRNNIAGVDNVGLGVSSLHYNQGGDGNTAIGGYGVLRGNAVMDVSFNVAIGSGAGYNIATGADNNVLVGYEAGNVVTTGANNTFFGYQAGDNITTGDNNIVIGAGIDAVSTTADNQLNIGNTIYGDLSTDQVGIGVTDPQTSLEVAGTISATGVEVAGTVTATNFVGDGSGLTNLSVSGDQIVSGTTSVVASENTSLTFTTGGTTAMVIGSDQQVGIGTDTPSDTLHIHTDNGRIRLSHSATNTVNQILFYEDATLQASIGVLGTAHAATDRQNNMEINTRNSGDLIFQTLTGSGNIGVGTDIASQTLTVSGTAWIKAAQFDLVGGASAPISVTSTSEVDGAAGAVQFSDGSNFASDATNFFWDDTTNRLGLGTGAPSATLHISGTMILADGGESCDATIIGAIKYTSGDLYVCDGSSWSTVGGSATSISDSDNDTMITLENAGDTDTISFTTAGSVAVVIDSSQMVGIGTESPSETLHVNGAVQIAGQSANDCTATEHIGKIHLNPATNKLQLCKP